MNRAKDRTRRHLCLVDLSGNRPLSPLRSSSASTTAAVGGAASPAAIRLSVTLFPLCEHSDRVAARPAVAVAVDQSAEGIVESRRSQAVDSQLDRLRQLSGLARVSVTEWLAAS